MAGPLDGLTNFAATVFEGEASRGLEIARQRATVAGQGVKVQRMPDGTIAPITLYDGSTLYGRFYNQAATRSIAAQIGNDARLTFNTAREQQYLEDPDGFTEFANSYIDETVGGLPDLVQQPVRDDLSGLAGEYTNSIRQNAMRTKRKNEAGSLLADVAAQNKAIMGYASAGDEVGLSAALDKAQSAINTLGVAYGDIVDRTQLASLTEAGQLGVYAGRAARKVRGMAPFQALQYSEDIAAGKVADIPVQYREQVSASARADATQRIQIEGTKRALANEAEERQSMTSALELAKIVETGATVPEEIIQKWESEALAKGSSRMASIAVQARHHNGAILRREQEQAERNAVELGKTRDAIAVWSGRNTGQIASSSPLDADGQQVYDRAVLAMRGMNGLNPADPNNHPQLVQDIARQGFVPTLTLRGLTAIMNPGDDDAKVGAMVKLYRELFIAAPGILETYGPQLGRAKAVLDELATLSLTGTVTAADAQRVIQRKSASTGGGDGLPVVLKGMGKTEQERREAIIRTADKIIANEIDLANSLTRDLKASFLEAGRNGLAAAARAIGVDIGVYPVLEGEKEHDPRFQQYRADLHRFGVATYWPFVDKGSPPKMPSQMRDDIVRNTEMAATDLGMTDGSPEAVVKAGFAKTLQTWGLSQFSNTKYAEYSKWPVEQGNWGQPADAPAVWIREQLTDSVQTLMAGSIMSPEWKASDALAKGDLWLEALPETALGGQFPAYAIAFRDSYGNQQVLRGDDGRPIPWKPDWNASKARERYVARHVERNRAFTTEDYMKTFLPGGPQ